MTTEEQVVLALIGNGLSSRQISELLYLNSESVETHLKNLLRKFSAKNTAELVKKASRPLSVT